MQERPASLLVIHISAKQIKTSTERYRVESTKPSALLEVIRSSYHSLPAPKNQTSLESLGLVGQEVCFPNRYLPVISGFDFLYSVLCLWALCCRQGRRVSAVCESKPFLLAYDTAWTCSNGRDLCLSSQFHFSSCSLPACLFWYSLGAGKWHCNNHWYVR